MTSTAIDWLAIASLFPGIEVISLPVQLTKLSLDYYHFSPVLEPQLKDKRANLVLRRTTEDLIKKPEK